MKMRMSSEKYTLVFAPKVHCGFEISFNTLMQHLVIQLKCGNIIRQLQKRVNQHWE